jgi:hypothetical protein
VYQFVGFVLKGADNSFQRRFARVGIGRHYEEKRTYIHANTESGFKRLLYLYIKIDSSSSLTSSILPKKQENNVNKSSLLRKAILNINSDSTTNFIFQYGRLFLLKGEQAFSFRILAILDRIARSFSLSVK